MSEKIISALQGLDPENVNHWTADGQPRLDTVRMLAADQSVSRADIDAVAPGFTRTNRVIEPVQEPQTGALATQPTDQGGSEDDDSKSPAAPQAEQPQVDDPEAETGKDNDTGDLEEQLAEAKKTLTAAKAELNTAQKKYHLAQAAHDELLLKAEAEETRDTNAQDIQAYLASQRQSLAERGARIKAIKDSGINLRELQKSLKSPLDASRQRKTGR